MEASPACHRCRRKPGHEDRARPRLPISRPPLARNRDLTDALAHHLMSSWGYFDLALQREAEPDLVPLVPDADHASRNDLGHQTNAL